MTEFKEKLIKSKEGFWAMYYFLKEHSDLSNGQLTLDELLSFCEPLIDGSPSDEAMIEYWEEAIQKYNELGIPGNKELNK